MNVKTDIITNEKSDVLTIPIQASGKRKIDDKLKETVFVVQDSKAILTEITVGASSDTEVEIISGIDEGDTVIIGPYRVLSKLKDGQKVKPKVADEDESESDSSSE